jgi:hypothetical protein
LVVLRTMDETCTTSLENRHAEPVTQLRILAIVPVVELIRPACPVAGIAGHRPDS